MDLYILALPNTKCSIGCLVLYSWIPPTIKMKYMIGSGQIQPNTARLEREDKKRRATALLLKVFYHHITLLLRCTTMQEKDITIKGLLQMLAQQCTHLGKLSKDQRLLARRQHLFKHLFKTGQFARTPW